MKRRRSHRQIHLVVSMVLIGIGSLIAVGCDKKEVAIPATTQGAPTATKAGTTDADAQAAQRKLDDQRGREAQEANARTQ